mgnify:CR=1 FL=1
MCSPFFLTQAGPLDGRLSGDFVRPAFRCLTLSKNFFKLRYKNKNKKMTIKPLSDHILIEPVKEEEKTKTGIFLPDTASKERSEEGKIIAVGPGKKTDDGKIIMMSVKPGDRVLFSKYGPNEIKIEGKEYLIVSESDILAIIE